MPRAEREVGTMMAPATIVMNIENRQVLHRQKVQRVLNNLPPFSIILNRLIGSLSSENVRFSDLASLIEKDTVLSGHVLRLVNSAAMARRSRINSNFVLSLSIARLWQSTKTVSPWSMAQFNLHGAAVALLSDLLAQNCHCQYPEGAFLAGLLHDYGKLLIAAALPEQFLEIQRQLGEGHLTQIELEHELTGFTHPELSAMTLRAWSLPDDIVRGVEYHHSPDAEEQALLEPVGGMLLGRIVFTADAVAHQMGLHVTSAEGSLEVRREQAIGTLEALGFAGKANKILASNPSSKPSENSSSFCVGRGCSGG
jgi:HD-like signal output (HDOD) protein